MNTLQEMKEEVEWMRYVIRRIIGALWFMSLMLVAGVVFAYLDPSHTVQNILNGSLIALAGMTTFIRYKVQKRYKKEQEEQAGDDE